MSYTGYWKARHQIFVTDENQDRARDSAHRTKPIRSKSSCPKCGKLVSSRKKGQHVRECNGKTT